MKKFPHTEYDPKRFPGLIYKLEKPKVAMLVFASGTIVVIGSKNEGEVYEAVKTIIKNLESKGILEKPKASVKIVNVVGTANLHGEIDLEKAAMQLDFCIYEPSEFPGLIYHMKEPKVVILLFGSGKIVCVGALKERDVSEAVDGLRKELEEKNLIIPNL